MTSKAPINGLSLIEVMIALAIMALLLFSSLYYAQTALNYYRRQQVATQLQQLLLFARQASVHGHQRVKVCAQGSEGQCGSDWRQGVLVLTNGAHPTILQQTPAFKIPGKIIWQGWLKHPYVQFEADGLPHSYHGSFWWCNGRQAQPLIYINHLGQVRAVDNKPTDEVISSPC